MLLQGCQRRKVNDLELLFLHICSFEFTPAIPSSSTVVSVVAQTIVAHINRTILHHSAQKNYGLIILEPIGRTSEELTSHSIAPGSKLI